ncbi:MFS transporter [Rhizobium sp. 2YAF20]|uniref:MFS transporter n=1 Tax=Rhizobium sp. 2YAF20 TaxID=3233027 RepID=UPI003F9A7B10
MILGPHHRIYICFFLFAVTLGAFFARIPDLQQSLQIDKSELGLTLIGAAIGALVSLTFGSSVVARMGARTSAFATILGIPTVLVFVPWMPNAQLVFLLLFLEGLLAGALEINLNVEIDRIQSKLGRGVMNRAHGFWSVGFFVTALISSPIRQAGISIHVHLAASLAVALVVGIIAIWNMEGSPPQERSVEGKSHGIAVPTLGMLPLCAIGIAALLVEGAGIDWSAIYMRDVFAVEPLIGGLGLTLFALFMAVARLSADPLVDRYGPVRIAMSLILLAGAGLMVLWLAQIPQVALVGFACLGAGCSAVYPLAISAAMARTDRRAHENVAALGQTSFIVFFLGPPLLGFIAQGFGIRNAYFICLPIVCVALFCVKALKIQRSQEAIGC